MDKIRNFISSLRNPNRGNTKTSSSGQLEITNNNISTKNNIRENDTKESNVVKIINDDTQNKIDKIDIDGITEHSNSETHVLKGNKVNKYFNNNKDTVLSINEEKSTNEVGDQSNGGFHSKITNSHQYNNKEESNNTCLLSDKNTDGSQNTLEMSSKEQNDVQCKESCIFKSIDKEISEQNNEIEVSAKECYVIQSKNNNGVIATETNVSKGLKIVEMNKAEIKVCKNMSENFKNADEVKDSYSIIANVDSIAQSSKPQYLNTYNSETEFSTAQIQSHIIEGLISHAVFPDLAKLTETVDAILSNRPNIATIENDVNEHSYHIDSVHLNNCTELQNSSDFTTKCLKEFDQVLAEVKENNKLPIAKAPSLEELDDIILDENLDFNDDVLNLDEMFNNEDINMGSTYNFHDIKNVVENIDSESKILAEDNVDVISISSDDSVEENSSTVFEKNANCITKTNELQKVVGEIKTYKIKKFVIKKHEATTHSDIQQTVIANETGSVESKTPVGVKRVHDNKCTEKVTIYKKKIVEETRITEIKNFEKDKTKQLKSLNIETTKHQISGKTTTAAGIENPNVTVEANNFINTSATEMKNSGHNKITKLELQRLKKVKTIERENSSETEITEIENSKDTNSKLKDSEETKHTEDNNSKDIKTTQIINPIDAKTTEVDNLKETENSKETNIKEIKVEEAKTQEVKNSKETYVTEIQNTKDFKPSNNILDSISISSEVDSEIYVKSSQEESEDCGYHSSDFEFISEEEAKMDGFIINFDAKRHTTKRVKVLDKKVYGPGTSRYESDPDWVEDGESSSDDSIETYIVPEERQVEDMFRNMPAMLTSEIHHLENKSIHTRVPVLVQYEGVGFDLRLARHDSEDDECKLY